VLSEAEPPVRPVKATAGKSTLSTSGATESLTLIRKVPSAAAAVFR
jgi:hypothetical protein